MLLILTAHAGIKQQANDPSNTTPAFASQTDSLAPVNEIKNSFRDLFMTTSMVNGIKVDKLNPLAISFVEDYMSKNAKGLQKMKDWGKPYFDMMDLILVQHGVPKELKYLAVIESGLKVNAKSWAGAVGPWAFMPAAAREYGLKVYRNYDERTDYYKSTHAAASLLTDLFVKYGDWLLVIAAYNGGPGVVNKAIRASGSRDFWTLQRHLPVESMNHVKKFIATHYIMQGEGGITTSTKGEMKDIIANGNVQLTNDELTNSRTQVINGRYISLIITKHITMDLAAFNRYNPGFDSQVSTQGSYEMRLPNDKMDLFIAKKAEILNESLQLLLNR